MNEDKCDFNDFVNIMTYILKFFYKIIRFIVYIVIIGIIIEFFKLMADIYENIDKYTVKYR